MISTLAGTDLLRGVGALAGVFASTLTGHESTIDERMFLPLTAVAWRSERSSATASPRVHHVR